MRLMVNIFINDTNYIIFSDKNVLCTKRLYYGAISYLSHFGLSPKIEY